VSRGPLVIVGDALLDRDVEGRAERLCPDAPVPVVDVAAARERPGGAALAALLACRGDGPGQPEVVLVTPLGADRASQAVRDLLPAEVSVVPLSLSGPLQEKTRFMAAGRTVLRVDTPAPAPGRAGQRAVAAIRSAGALLVSDYGHGTAASRVIRDALASRAGQVPLVWDPHPRGPALVPGTRLATPNEAEATSRGGLRETAAAAGRLLARWPTQAISVTLGARGALLVRRGQAPLAVPATPASGGDACGAGDLFAVAAAAALRDGALLSEAVTWAVAAASGYVAGGGAGSLRGTAGGRGTGGTGGGNGTADQAGAGDRAGPDDLGEAGSAPLVTDDGNGARRGGVLVAAGGCFDVLHAGHVSMLRAARRLGDALVVCMNSDASVRRLKGPGRPLNPAADRAAVLRALDCVDEVVIFDEDTPERLLARLRPDIWVKGGDYDGRELPEAAVLREWGGMVVTVPYLDGRSTTRIATAAARSLGSPSASR
jgi:D-beta-D-heptose 7-phosphate kinase/D-beta-D-heptose 1-phosphate adenosyltransferase